MRPLIPAGDRFAVGLALSFLGVGVFSALSPVAAQAQYIVKPVAELKVKQLPKGELYWHVESFPTLEEAKAAAPPYRWNPDTVSSSSTQPSRSRCRPSSSKTIVSIAIVGALRDVEMSAIGIWRIF